MNICIVHRQLYIKCLLLWTTLYTWDIVLLVIEDLAYQLLEASTAFEMEAYYDDSGY